MNKIIRIASVFALACAALLYTGCTKDFSEDIARLEDQKATKTDVAAVNEALNAYKQEANAAIDAIKAELPNKANVADLNALKTRVDGIEPIANTNKADIAALQTKVGTIDSQLQGFITEAKASLLGLQGEDERLAQAIAAVESAYKAADSTINGKIDVINAKIHELDSVNTAAHTAIETAYKAADAALQAKIDTLETRATALETKVSDLETAVAKLEAQMKDVIAMVQSINFVPGSYNHVVVGGTDITSVMDWEEVPIIGSISIWIPKFISAAASSGAHAHAFVGTEIADVVARDYYLNPQGAAVVSNPVFEATFQVTPAEAAKNLTKDNLAINVVATKAFAAAPVKDSVVITSVVARETVPGYVDIIGYIKKGEATLTAERSTAAFDAVLVYEAEKESGVKESIATSSFNIVSAAAVTSYTQDGTTVKEEVINPDVLLYSIFDKTAKAVLTANKTLDSVVVTPATPDPKKTIFEPARWDVYATIDADGKITGSLETIAALIGATVDQVKPAVGDTVVTTETAYPKLPVIDKRFASTVEPAESVIKILKDSHATGATPKVVASVSLKNSQVALLGGTQTTAPSAKVIGSYILQPVIDSTTAKFVDNPSFSIAWDWKKVENVLAKADTIKGIEVSDVDSLMVISGPNDGSEGTYTETTVVKIYNKATKAVVPSVGSKLVKVDGKHVDIIVKADIKYAATEQTYVYEVSRHDHNIEKNYIASFEFTVAAIPTIAPIAVPDTTIILDNFGADYTVANDAAKTFATTLAAAITAKSVSPMTVADVPTLGTDTDAKPASYINYDNTVIAKAELAYGQVAVASKYTVLEGVTVNVSRNVTINKPACTLVANPGYLTTVNAKEYSVEVRGYMDEATHKYTLATMPIPQYLTVAGNGTETSKYTLQGTFTATDGAIVNSPVAVTADKFAADTVKWGACDTTTFDVIAKLVVPGANNTVLDTAKITFWTKDPLNAIVATDQSVVESFSETTVANLFPALSLKDIYGNELVDANHNRMHHYSVINYGQNETPVKFSIEDGPEALLPFAEIVNNQFVLHMNQATLTGDASFKIKAVAHYMFGKKEATFNVIVKKYVAE